MALLLKDIQYQVENALKELIWDLEREHCLKTRYPLLYEWIEKFVLRKGKNVRSSLFVMAFSGFTGKIPANLFRSAGALELAHDFTLIHDDLIDRADMRRGAPALHTRINRYIKSLNQAATVRGEDVSLVVGDILYALAMREFLSIEADPERKITALNIFLETGFLTGNGQFVELMNGLRAVSEMTEAEIYRPYDLKTAYYTFAGPLACGAVLAGAPKPASDSLFQAGIILGRAYQIRDDILDLFHGNDAGNETVFNDIVESKRTILLHYAYHHADKRDRAFLDRLLSSTTLLNDDFLHYREIIERSGSLAHARGEIQSLVDQIFSSGALAAMNGQVAGQVVAYTRDLLTAE